MAKKPTKTKREPPPVLRGRSKPPSAKANKHGKWSWSVGEIQLPDGSVRQFEGFDEAGEEQLRQHLGFRVRLCRSELGLTQSTLAASFGRTRSWIRGIEAGVQYPPHDFLIELAGIVGRSVAWFYEGVPFAGEGDTAGPNTPLEQVRRALAALMAAEKQLEEDERLF